MTNRDEEILGMIITINTIKLCTDILDCMRADKIRLAILDNEHLHTLADNVLHGWLSTKAEM